ncbi:LysR family transcriptional regulator [Verticiella sediminum]|uniref:LysR family transcriptional regulator n=1 Tax=Verticiella sediminum TaxID=1247510 RepID=A0A556ACC4_9BURK|nr:LysR family transcriptional regulator [Verticiella sediminum]TSH90530.1 LysR family transcriptional regulator [Verticiella sediminum]
MDIRKLRYFVAVAEELSFSRAARRLSISQPPLSTQIKELESELGVRLLERSPREVKLTGPGEVFLSRARAILEQIDAAAVSTRRAADGGFATIRIGVVASGLFTATPLLTAHAERIFPRAEISLFEMGSAEQLSAVLREQIDIGLVHAPVDVPNLNSRLLTREPYVIATSSARARGRPAPAGLHAFADEPFIGFSREVSPALYDNLIVACRQAGFSPKLMHTARHVFTMLQLVREDRGVALVPASVAQAGIAGIALFALTDRINEVRISAVWRSHPSRLVQALVADLAPALALPDAGPTQ